MTRHDLSVHIDRIRASTTAALEAHVATRELSGRMISVARKVTADPKSFSSDDAAKLRNAAQVASSAADLIDGGIK